MSENRTVLSLADLILLLLDEMGGKKFTCRGRQGQEKKLFDVSGS